MSANRVIGVDLGGTKILAGIVDADGEVHETVERPTVTTSQAALLDELAQLVLSLPQDGIDAVGFGIPSRIDQARGTVLGAVNIPFRDVPFRDEMQTRLGKPVAMENDASCAAFAEFRFGAGRGTRDFVMLTLGTGVGGGFVLDGRLVLGYHGTAGELGHQVIDCNPGAPQCGCGNTGCLESFVRAAALAGAAGTATAAEAFAADERGDPRAHAAVEQWIDYLAIGLANVVTVLTPDRIVLGGGVATAAARILAPLRERLAAHVHLTDPNHVEIVHAALGVRAGAIGAALRGLDA
jgi:glucokinase